MYAPQPSRPPVRPPVARSSSDQGRSPHRAHHARQHHTRQDVAVEVGAKLAVNLTLAVIALVYLGRLLNYNLTQKQKLEHLQAEVVAVDERVSKLRDQFSIQFDTHQTQQLVRQQRHRISPNQMQVIWTTPPVTAPSPDATQPAPPESDATLISSQP